MDPDMAPSDRGARSKDGRGGARAWRGRRFARGGGLSAGARWADGAAWAAIGTLAVLLWVPLVRTLATEWKEYHSLSDGPVIVGLALLHLASKRGRLRRWDQAWTPGLLMVIPAAVLHVGSYLADVE